MRSSLDGELFTASLKIETREERKLKIDNCGLGIPKGSYKTIKMPPGSVFELAPFYSPSILFPFDKTVRSILTEASELPYDSSLLEDEVVEVVINEKMEAKAEGEVEEETKKKAEVKTAPKKNLPTDSQELYRVKKKKLERPIYLQPFL